MPNPPALIDSFRQELRLQESNFRPLLPKSINPEKFEAIVVAAVSGNQKLLECKRATLWKACIQSAELGLSLNPTLGEADILPVWSKALNGFEAQFRPRWKGLIKLARQSGELTSVWTDVVCEKDEFEEIGGLRRDLIHKKARGDRGPWTDVYCVWTLKGVADPQFEVMSKQDVMKIKRRSSSKNAAGEVVGPWVTDEIEMARKTVAKRASKYWPSSCEELHRAIAADNIAESGGTFDIDPDSGEIIDITAHDIPDDASVQVDAIEASLVVEPEPEPSDEVEPAIEEVVFQPTDDWTTWCRRAYKACQALPEHRRLEWIKLHSTMLEEAAQSKPAAVAHIRKLTVKESE